MPGGVLDGELLSICDVFFNGGIQLKHTSLGLGPKLIPPQELQGGVGGGLHGDSMIAEEKSGAADAGFSGSASSPSTVRVHSHVLHLHSGHPYKTSSKF